VIVISAAVLAAAAASPTMAGDLTPRQIYENAAPGVVVVVGTEEQGKGSTGTGAIIDPQGLVFTNAHVVIDKDTGKPFAQLLVILKPDRVTGRPDQDYARRFKARVVAINRELDLAALRFDPGSSKPRVLPISNPDRLQIGDWVAAIGHPEQGGLWTYTTGVVSAEFEDFHNTKGKHVFQTEIGMNRGNSGGPLLDANGHVVGVNTSIARLAPDGLPITSISFSVKSSVLQEWLAGQGIRVAYSEPPRPSPAAQPALSQGQAPPTAAEPPSVAQAPVASPTPPAPEPPAPASTTPSAPPAAVSTPPPSPAPQPVSPKIVEAPTAPPKPATPSPTVAAPAPVTPAPKVAEAPAAVQAPVSDKPARAKPAKPAEDSKPFKTKARPYDPDRLVDEIRRLDSDMEDLAEEMRKKFRPR
jgi:serine protease Do